LEEAFDSASNFDSCNKFNVRRSWSFRSNVAASALSSWPSNRLSSNCTCALYDVNFQTSIDEVLRSQSKCENVASWDVSRITSLASAFRNATNFNADISRWNVEQVTSLHNTFYGARSFDQDISRWNVKRVTDLSGTFHDAANFDHELSTWNVDKVTNMSSIFEGASNFNKDLSTWNIERVTDMSSAFKGATSFNMDISAWNVARVTTLYDAFEDTANLDLCKKFNLRRSWSSQAPITSEALFSLPLNRPSSNCTCTLHDLNFQDSVKAVLRTENFCEDISLWDVSRVTDISSAFRNASNFNDDVSRWNVARVTNMKFTFSGAANFNQELSSWNVEKVTDMSSMFLGAVRFNRDISAWNVARVAALDDIFEDTANLDMCNMFNLRRSWGFRTPIASAALSSFPSNRPSTDCTCILHNINFQESINEVVQSESKCENITLWNVSRITSLSDAFTGCTAFNQDISRWNVELVTDLSSTFAGATNFDRNLSSWNVERVASLYGTFDNATNFNGDISSWNIEQVTSLRYTFRGAMDFNGDLSGWNVEKVTTLANAFNGATSFNQDISRWNVEQVTSMHRTFFGTTKFDRDLFNWNVERVSSLLGTFNEATLFNGDVSSWNVERVTSLRHTFSAATHFNQNISAWNIGKVDTLVSTFDGASSFNQDISRWNVEQVTSMYRTFSAAATFNGDLSDWNTRKLMNLGMAFSTALEFDSDLSGWNVEKVSQFDGAFDGTRLSTNGCTKRRIYDAWHSYSWFYLNSWQNNLCDCSITDREDLMDLVRLYIAYPDALTAQGCPPIELWNVSSVTDMRAVFSGYSNFNADLALWDVSNVKTIGSMFHGAAVFNADLSAWNTEKVTFMGEMFRGASSMNFDLSQWDIRAVDGLSVMFDGTASLTDCFKFKLAESWREKWNVQENGDFPYGWWNVTYRCHCTPQNRSELIDSINTWLWSRDIIESECGPIFAWDVSTIRNMSMLLAESNAASSFDADISDWNVANVVDMQFMFKNATSFNADISRWDVRNVRNMKSIFDGAASFDVDLSSWTIARDVLLDRAFVDTNVDPIVQCNFYDAWKPSANVIESWEWNVAACDISSTPSTEILKYVLPPICAFILALIGAFLVWRRRTRLKLLEKEEEARRERQDKLMMESAWKIDWNVLDLIRTIAAGSFGEVWQGVMNGTQDVAVKKMLNTERVDLDAEPEIRFLKRARHPKLVWFMGCGHIDNDATKNLFVVLEYMNMGDLSNVLWTSKREKSGAPPPTWKTRMSLLKDTAEGMSYIHGTLDKLHRDLKSLNVLLTKQKSGKLVGKVADFGLAKGLKLAPASGAIASSKTACDIDVAQTSLVGSILWMAPEVFPKIGSKGKARYDKKIDVYSFGIIMWESLTLSKPWTHDGTRFQRGPVRAIIMEAVENGERLPISDAAKKVSPSGFIALMEKCWDANPNARLPFLRVLYALQDMELEITNRRTRPSADLSASESAEGNMPVRETFSKTQKGGLGDIELVAV